MRFFRRHSFGCHVPYSTALPETGLELRTRAWDPALLISPAERRIFVDGHAREVLTSERLLLPDDGVVFLGWRLSRWLMSIPGDHALTGARATLAGRSRVFDAYAMHVPGRILGASGALLSITLRSSDRTSRGDDPLLPLHVPGPAARFPSIA